MWRSSQNCLWRCCRREWYTDDHPRKVRSVFGLATTTRSKPQFNPKTFLATVGEGHSVVNYGKNQPVFQQGDPADAVFFVQKGKVKVTVVSEQGKEAVVA